MNTTERLAFRLTIAEPNTDERTITVCPRYDNLKLKWSRPTGQMYYTEDISGTLKFLGVDFQTINACALNTQFTLIVYQNRVEVGRSLFRKTDCKWDIDHGVVDVDISVYDEYKKFQDKKDEEYNLVKLGIDKHRLNMYVYPQNQVYFQDDNIITLFGSQGTPAQPSVSPTHNNTDLKTRMWFNDGVISGAVKLDVGGEEFTFKAQFSDFSITIQPSSGYHYKCVHLGDKVIQGKTYGLYFGYYESSGQTIQNFSDGLKFAVIWYYSQSPGLFITSAQTRYDSLYSLIGLHIGGTGLLDYSCRIWVSYTGLATMQELPGLLMPSDDITAEFNNNMKSRAPETMTNDFVETHIGISTRTSTTDKGYGIVENEGTYYNTPDDDHIWVPVRKESWFGGISLWVEGFYVDQYYSNSYREGTGINDFYLLTDAIRAVVQKMDEDIQFDSLDSQFLFNSLNPLNGIQQGALHISQKSNILNLGYDYPAWLAPVKWSQIETLLREAFDCYWSLYVRDGHKHLRIEHRRWYELGGTYTQSAVQVASIDLTATFRNGTSFTFGEKTRHWEFDTDGNGTFSTASRHEYGWMDTQSEIFDGQPITIPEEYRLFTDEKTEQHKVDWFSSDIDFLTSVQAECSSDGFAIVMENPNQPNWIITGATEYSGQNYQLSFDYLQGKYLLQGIYAEYIKIGDNATLTSTGSNARMRTSEIQLRVPAGMSIEASDTIKTQVGIGVIDTLEYDLHSELYTAKLRYENE